MDIARLSINTIRTLSIDAIQKANSGHPGLPMGAAPMAYVLWQNHLKHTPQDPTWPDRDRFVLSPGHGSMLLYSLLHLTGYPLSLDEIKNFRQEGSLTPGHPEASLTPGVEATTGPLGQGTAVAVGMAIAERKLANCFNQPGFDIVDHFTYALVSDGDLMEGISAEVGSLAGQLGLGKLIYLYDSNDITLDGPTSMTFDRENLAARYEAYGWHVQEVKKGDLDLTSLDQAIAQAKSETAHPSLIIVKTTIGYGSPNKQGKSVAHGAPLGEDEIVLTKKALGWDAKETFTVPEEVRKHFGASAARGESARQDWQKKITDYSKEFPDLKQKWDLAHAGELPTDWAENEPSFETAEKLATRQASGKMINALARKIPWLLGGDADLGCSTNTIVKDGGSFEGQRGSGRNIHYGVREHGMAGIANGIAYHRGIRPFVATFFCFFDYMKPSVRLACMDQLPTIYVWTHDSVALGEDGPTHQPIEHLAALRAIPHMTVIRPADANETREAWKFAAGYQEGPVALVLTRQKLPTLGLDVSQLSRGAYVISPEKGDLQACILATGSEVHLALAAQRELPGARVISMPSWELFERQDQKYRDEVLPPYCRARVSVEAGRSFGWEKWVGLEGRSISIDRFGMSAPGPDVQSSLGLVPEKVVSAVRSLLS